MLSHKWKLRIDLQLYLIYSLITLIVLFPMLKFGYVLTLDMVFTPMFRLPTQVTNEYIWQEILHYFNFVCSGQIIEKIILFFILFLSGLEAHKLTQYIISNKRRMYDQIGWYFAGIMYMINPFTYDRFMTGQYEILLGYALLPWFVRSLLVFDARPTLSQSLRLVAWALTISIVYIHAVGFVTLLVIIGYVVSYYQKRKDKVWITSALKYGAISLVIFIIASSYWLIPLLLGHGSTASTIDNFTSTDQAAFSTLGGSVIGRFYNVIRLQGFWAENTHMYILPQAKVSVWGLVSFLILLLVVIGAVKLWRENQKFVVMFFGLSAFISAVLAVGLFNSWLAAHVPFFAGYREPEKFVALIALTYAVFASHGVPVVLKYFKDQGGQFIFIGVSILVLLLPLVWTPTMLWGFNNQLKPVQYPADWYSVNKQLDADTGNFKVLFLPWHLYMSFDFADRIIANPAPQFFDKPVIISDNPEFKGIKPPYNAVDSGINHILLNANGSTTLGLILARYQIKYILLSRDDDYANYGYLNSQKDLKLVSKGDTLELYRNEAYKG